MDVSIYIHSRGNLKVQRDVLGKVVASVREETSKMQCWRLNWEETGRKPVGDSGQGSIELGVTSCGILRAVILIILD